MAHWIELRYVKLSTLLVLLLFFQPLHALELCADLQGLLSSQPGFANFRGAPAPHDRWYAKPDNLGGMGACTVRHDTSAAHITCTSDWIMDEQSAIAKRSAAVAAIQKCLGSEWQSTDNSLGDSLKGTIFSSLKGSNTYFSLALYQIPRPTPKWQLWFSATMSSPTAKQTNSPGTRTDEPVELGWRKGEPTLCKDLSIVIAGATDKFSAMKGRKVHSYWLPTFAITGVNQCKIYVSDRLVYYTCVATNGDGENESRKVFTALTSDVQACLPRPWVMAKDRDSDGLPRVKFTHPLQTGTVVIRMRELVGDYSVKLDVDAD